MKYIVVTLAFKCLQLFVINSDDTDMRAALVTYSVFPFGTQEKYKD